MPRWGVIALLLVGPACSGPGGLTDAGPPDASKPDAGVMDSGVPDSGVPDSGVPDSGTSDAGRDAGEPDAGVDAGCTTASCDDNNPCTVDRCDAVLGCVRLDVRACATPFCQRDAGCGDDGDQDGLSDAWEMNGYVDVDCNGRNDGPDVDVPLPGANPGEPDLFVRYDYMQLTDGGHDHRPRPAALAQVVEAFALHGVHLHFVGTDAGIPETVVTTLDSAPDASCSGPSVTTMQSLRASRLGNWQLAYRYLVFAHRVTCPDAVHCLQCQRDPFCGVLPDSSSAGLADLPGDDAIVALGAFLDLGQPAGVEVEASFTMHELGHTLGLKHGGDAVCRDKSPNYRSVMNNSYAANGRLLAVDAGSSDFRVCASDPDCGCSNAHPCHCTDDFTNVLGTEICYRVDYSSASAPTLNELVTTPGVGGLDEDAGFGAPPGDDELVMFWAPGPALLFGPSIGPIDWNNDTVISDHVQADLDHDGTFTLLTTRDDWARDGGAFLNLRLSHQCTPGYGAGTPRVWSVGEPSAADALRSRKLWKAIRPR